MNTGATLWFTGLSGAGKTTISRIVQEELTRRGYPVELLDGDELRKHFNHQLGFSKQDRLMNIQLAAYIAEVLNRHGVIVLAAFISPYQEFREQCRKQISQYMEVYVKCSVDVCIERDVKGLYRKALTGEILHFTGISDVYEEPENPDLLVETAGETPEESAAKVIALLQRRGYISEREECRP